MCLCFLRPVAVFFSQHALLACTGPAAASAACARMEGDATASLGSACAPAAGPGRPVSWVSTPGGPCGYGRRRGRGGSGGETHTVVKYLPVSMCGQNKL